MDILTRGGAMATALIIVVLVVPLVLLNVASSPEERLNQSRILSNITQGLAHAGELKVYVAEYQQLHGELPDGAADLKLDGEEATNRRRSLGLAIGGQGLITLHVLDTNGATVGTIQLRPVADAPSLPIEWTCTTADFRRIQRFVPQCEYVGADGKSNG